MRLLLAEDDLMLGDGLRAGLRQQGFQVDWVRDGIAAELEIASGDYQRRCSTWDCREKMAWRCCRRCAAGASQHRCWC